MKQPDHPAPGAGQVKGTFENFNFPGMIEFVGCGN